ncbi:MAG: hypothetical protein AMXMBFR4_23340 [Candidatus Hydrogenedentota bacterium]
MLGFRRQLKTAGNLAQNVRQVACRNLVAQLLKQIHDDLRVGITEGLGEAGGADGSVAREQEGVQRPARFLAAQRLHGLKFVFVFGRFLFF